eukprot:2427550-Lingulodinium_polyedra.AAC.1
MRAPENWRAREVRGRAICEPLRPRTVDSTASLRGVLQTLHNDAVESIVRRHGGSLITRSRVPCARQKFGARVECASVRRGRGRSIRAHRCAAFCNVAQRC